MLVSSSSDRLFIVVVKKVDVLMSIDHHDTMANSQVTRDLVGLSYTTPAGRKVHYAFIAVVNVHEGGNTVAIVVAVFLVRRQRKHVGLGGKRARPGSNRRRK